MSADYFAEFDTLRYEGPDSRNDPSFRWYNKDRVVLGKAIHAPDTGLASIADRAVAANSAPRPQSGRQKWRENLINRF